MLVVCCIVCVFHTCCVPAACGSHACCRPAAPLSHGYGPHVSHVSASMPSQVQTDLYMRLYSHLQPHGYATMLTKQKFPRAPLRTATHVSTYMSTHTPMRTSTHVYTHTYAHVYTHVYTHVYAHACAHVCTHVYRHPSIACMYMGSPVV